VLLLDFTQKESDLKDHSLLFEEIRGGSVKNNLLAYFFAASRA
jgi:hypothetical protein